MHFARFGCRQDIYQIMHDHFILVVLTFKLLCPSLIYLPPSWSSLFGALPDWSVLIAAYRLAAIWSALVE